MIFKDLPAFLEYLEKNNHLKRIKEVVSTQLEVTEISKRILHNNGPALLFENVIKEDGKKSLRVMKAAKVLVIKYCVG